VAAAEVLAVDASVVGRSITVRLRGEFDLSGVLRFWDSVGEPERHQDVTVDLREVTFLDGAAMRQLLTLDARSRRDGFAYRIYAPFHPAARIFEITGMNTRLPLVAAL
jgi:anti-anti-sigma factor